MAGEREWITSLSGRVVGGRYRLKACLGMGGMAAVLAAEQIDSGEYVAVKILRPDVSEEDDLRERLRREGTTMAALRHPNVASVLDYGVDPDVGGFLVMEYLRGESLYQRLRMMGRPMSAEHTIAILDQVLDALRVIHSAGFVHRDITPGNVFLLQDLDDGLGVKILDFGIAKLLGSRWETLTTKGMALGTPGYMASEQARGFPDIDARVDICAVGRIAYRCLSGLEPFGPLRGLELLRVIAMRGPDPIHSVCKGLHPALCSVVDQANQFDRDDRFQTAEAFQRALRHAAQSVRAAAPHELDEVTVDTSQEFEQALLATSRAKAVSAAMTVGNRYELYEQIAAGGMGAVYRARHLVSHRVVALKLLHSHLTSDPEVIERFEQEARIVSHLSHPGLVDILDAGVDDQGQCFIAMELLRGEPLSARTAAGPLPNDEIGWIFLELTEALAVLHASGIVHQDLKPQNVFIARAHDLTERVKLLDFGITRPSGKGTHENALVGTPAFMAPERIDPRATVEPTSDVWSVGVMLYQALTGRPPFVGDSAIEVIARAANIDPVPVLSLHPECDPGFARIVDLCLMKDPGRRPRDGRALRDLFRDVVESRRSSPRALDAESFEIRIPSDVTAPSRSIGVSTSTAMPMTTELPAEGSGRRLGLIGAALLGALVMLGLIAVVIYFLWPDAESADPVATPAPVQDAGARSTAHDILQELIDETPAETLARGQLALRELRLTEAEAAFRRVIQHPDATPDQRAAARIGDGDRQIVRVEQRIVEQGVIADDAELSDMVGSLESHLIARTVHQFEYVVGLIFPVHESQEGEAFVQLEGVSPDLRQCAHFGAGRALHLWVDGSLRLAGGEPDLSTNPMTHPRFQDDTLEMMERHLVLADNQMRIGLEMPLEGSCHASMITERARIRRRMQAWSGRAPLIDRFFPDGVSL